MSFRRYAKYKSSGTECLEEVPEHWDMKRIRFISTLNPSKSEISHLNKNTFISFLPMESIGNNGSLNLDQRKMIQEVETGYTFFRNGDVSIAKITPCFENCKGALMHSLLNGVGFGTTELIVARPKPEVMTGQYMHWAFVSTPFRKFGEAHMYGAGGQKRVPDDFVRNFTITVPPLVEQSAITTFLDLETAKIDALINEQQRLIELLKEKRLAVISHAVTKGLNPNAPMKDSGEEWIGKVPEHWNLKKLKYICNIFPSNIDKKSCDFETDISLCNYTDVYYNDCITKEIDFMKATANEDQIAKFELKAGDVIITKDSEMANDIAIAAYVLTDLPGVVCGYHLSIVRPCHGNNGLYVKRLFDSHYLKSCVAVLANGLTRVSLSQAALDNLVIPLPPQYEQHAITDYLDLETAKLDGLSERTRQAISLLQERRIALITAAVTGKIDVRKAVKEGAL